MPLLESTSASLPQEQLVREKHLTTFVLPLLPWIKFDNSISVLRVMTRFLLIPHGPTQLVTSSTQVLMLAGPVSTFPHCAKLQCQKSCPASDYVTLQLCQRSSSEHYLSVLHVCLSDSAAGGM